MTRCPECFIIIIFSEADLNFELQKWSGGTLLRSTLFLFLYMPTHFFPTKGIIIYIKTIAKRKKIPLLKKRDILKSTIYISWLLPPLFIREGRGGINSWVLQWSYILINSDIVFFTCS